MSKINDLLKKAIAAKGINDNSKKMDTDVNKIPTLDFDNSNEKNTVWKEQSSLFNPPKIPKIEYFWFQFRIDFFEIPEMKLLKFEKNFIKKIYFYEKLLIISLTTCNVFLDKNNNKNFENVGKLLDFNGNPYDLKSLAKLSELSLKFVEDAMKSLLKVGLVNLCGHNIYELPKLVGLITKKGTSAERTRLYRQRKKEMEKQKSENSNLNCDVTCDVTETSHVTSQLRHGDGHCDRDVTTITTTVTDTNKTTTTPSSHVTSHNGDGRSSFFYEMKMTDDEWNEIDITPLEEINFTKNHLIQIYEQKKLTAEIVQESIFAFAWDLKNNPQRIKKINEPLNYFLGILLKGKPYSPAKNYETPTCEAMRLFREAKEREQKALDEMFKFSFTKWNATLSNDERKKFLAPEFQKLNDHEFNLSWHKIENNLRAYFHKNLWQEKLAELLETRKKHPRCI